MAWEVRSHSARHDHRKKEQEQASGGWRHQDLEHPYDWAGSRSVWVQKDTLKKTQPITSGIGKNMMEKMGWCEGQGLGANGQGQLEPILPAIKLDTRGLASEEETAKNLVQQIMTNLTSRTELDEKGMPVSILYNFCLMNKYPMPKYELIREEGPDHRKLFLYRVLVNEIFYQPTLSSPTKKEAKHLAAVVCLQAFRALPDDLFPNVRLQVDCQEISND